MTFTWKYKGDDRIFHLDVHLKMEDKPTGFEWKIQEFDIRALPRTSKDFCRRSKGLARHKRRQSRGNSLIFPKIFYPLWKKSLERFFFNKNLELCKSSHASCGRNSPGRAKDVFPMEANLGAFARQHEDVHRRGKVAGTCETSQGCHDTPSLRNHFQRTCQVREKLVRGQGYGRFGNSRKVGRGKLRPCVQGQI
ncbi:hypothetical protein GMAR_ORF26 [Golden Marseillevirus]|uniref:hypothetical protein n=1 Tax=Golden Marseillevirus TaxID=1720526 RepID=UPI000877A8FF|nr:hypothetical protein GMAR_ORF26 [Golden Marseillevirus]ALX27401.1 hypothetical protein GMAR_ORF26 [Golden Marseillevirus]